MRLPWDVKVSPKLSNFSVVAIVVAFSLVATGLSNMPTPGQASTYELICSKTSNATRTSEATSVTDTTLRLSITGTELTRGWEDSDWGFACAGEVIIPEGITRIDFGYFVPFLNNTPLSNNYLTSIVWPTTVQEIHIGLINLRGLTILDIPSSVSAISAQSFQSLSSLTDTIIQGPTSAANTLTLDQYVFNQTVTSLTIGNGYVNFGASFKEGAIFTSVKLGPNVRSIGDRAFAGTNDIRSFTSIEIPTGLTTIGTAAFADNPYLKTVSFGTGKPGITSFAADAFAGTTVIERVEYCGLIDPTLSNPIVEAYLRASLSSVPVYCSAPPPPPASSDSSAPPSAEVAGLSVRGSSTGNSSVVRIKLTKPPKAGEQMSVTVRLLDLDGNLTQELKIPVNSSTSSIEIPVNNVVGAFNMIAATSNGSVSSTPMSLLPEIIKAETMGASKPSRAKRLMGTLVSRDFIFTPNSAVLSPAVKKGLRKAAIVAKARNKRVAVTGFAAISGLGSIFERYVATKRARAVSEFLRKRGVESWIYYKGLSGLEGQIFPGQPRRVEIRILK
jgi:hypothetical protein